MTRFLPALVAGLVLASAVPALAGPEAPTAPKGPGHVFESVDAAAIDGLAWAHAEQRRSDSRRLSRGGVVLAVSGGYSYGPLQTATRKAPSQLSMQLGRDAVAHFHTYPQRSRRLDRRDEVHSRADRRVVDRGDSRHRPSYILTPSLRVVVYRGHRAPTKSEEFVARLARPGRLRLVAAH